MSKLTICVDFDGTIVDHAYPHVGVSNPGAIEWMKKWIELDAKLAGEFTEKKEVIVEGNLVVDDIINTIRARNDNSRREKQDT